MTTRGHKGPRLFVDGLRALLIAGPHGAEHRFELSKADSHYLRDVLRLREGDSIELADPSDGLTCIATLASTQPLVSVTTQEVSEPEKAQTAARVLLIALCKGHKNELLCDWATELGCSHICFWQATRSIVRLKNQKDANEKAERYAKLTRAAAQQSRQLRPPVVSTHLSLADALQALPQSDATRVCCSLAPEAVAISSFSTRPTAHDSFVVAIGPEGDLTTEEEQLLTQNGFTLVSLGSQILRSELAAVTSLVALGMARPS